MIETGATFVRYRQRLPLALRLFAGFLGLGIGTAIPAPFLIHMRWTTPPLSLVLAVAAILASVAFGLFLIVFALAPVADLRIDGESGMVTLDSRGPLGRRARRWPLKQLLPPEVLRREGEDGPFAVLRLHLPGWPRRIDMVPDTMAEAQALQARITAMIAAAQG